MRCYFCRRRLNRMVYYIDSLASCFDCFEDKLTEDFLNFNPNPDPVSVTEIINIV
jgi:hypothetical protein